MADLETFWCRDFDKSFLQILSMLLGLLEYFDFLSSMCNFDIVYFCIFCRSSLEILMFSCFVEFLEKILAVSLILHLVYYHQSLVE